MVVVSSVVVVSPVNIVVSPLAVAPSVVVSSAMALALTGTKKP